MKRLSPLLALALVVALPACQSARADAAVRVPAALAEAQEKPGRKVAVFAGGCFWGMEGVFSHLRGVTSVVSGYHGGSRRTATYERVSEGDTGHAESVRITYDPARIRYDQLLQVFFAVASDPTQLNRQEPDVGTQYRNAIVPQSPEQARVAAAYLAQLKARNPYGRPIVTAIEPNRGFVAAEDYHQDFMLKNPQHPYIVRWDLPRLADLKRAFPGLYHATFTPG